MKNARTDTRHCINCERRTVHTVWVRRCSTEGTRCNVCNHEE